MNIDESYLIAYNRLEVNRMYSNDFEHAFSEFLDRHEYDEAEHALFAIVRAAFAAGWKAAGGKMPQSEKIFQVLPDVRK